jgi:hypothetical protein
MMSIMNATQTMRRCALLLALALLPGAANADTDPPLPADAEAARVRGQLKVLSVSLRATGEKEPACKGWKLTKANVREFFQKAVPVSGEEFHALYYVLPCEYSGEIHLAGKTYRFVLNGGSSADLFTTSEPIVARKYGCRHGCERFVPFGDYPADGEEP